MPRAQTISVLLGSKEHTRMSSSIADDRRLTAPSRDRRTADHIARDAHSRTRRVGGTVHAAVSPTGRIIGQTEDAKDGSKRQFLRQPQLPGTATCPGASSLSQCRRDQRTRRDATERPIRNAMALLRKPGTHPSRPRLKAKPNPCEEGGPRLKAKRIWCPIWRQGVSNARG